jgi:hypothetical protein
MTRSVIRRPEMLEATLKLGGPVIDLAEYATTGIIALAVGPRGSGKTNAGMLVGEQLSEQGWVSVFVDPESEMESLYGDAVESPNELGNLLASRERKVIVIQAKDATEFIPYGRVLLRCADEFRKPLFIMIDEGQLFSATRKRKEDIGEATDIINDLVGRGRKRAVDLMITALRYTSTLNRSVFSNKNLTLIGTQEDPTVWSALAPQFRGSGIEFTDLNTLGPGEFYCISRRGMERVRMPMAKALGTVAQRAKPVRRSLPATFGQWNRAMAGISTDRLIRLRDSETINILGAIAGLSAQQMLTGAAALKNELEVRDEG